MLQGTKAKWLYWVALLLPVVGGLPARGQVVSAAEGGSQLGGFVAFGAQKTHVNAFNFNSLGMEGGIYLQKSRFFGIELKGDFFPFYARFKQAPFTAGYRVSGHLSRLHGMEVFGIFRRRHGKVTERRRALRDPQRAVVALLAGKPGYQHPDPKPLEVESVRSIVHANL